MVASKNRGKKSRSSKSGGGHVSGNPGKRAADEFERLLKVVYGPSDPAARSWWDASAADVVASAHRLEAVGGLLALEDAACRLLGEEMALRVEREDGGLDLPGWLKTVADRAAVHLQDSGSDADAPARSDDTASRLLLHVIVSTGTDRAAKAAKAHLDKHKRTTAAAAFAERYPWAAKASSARPTGGALAAVDAYGSRYLLVAPFQTPGDESTAHWYAWDIDLCDTQRVVGAGVFTDPDNALADWKDAVGATTAANSTMSPVSDPATIRDLLDDCLRHELVGGSIMGDETADLLSEYFRMRSRAHHLFRSLPGRKSDPRATADRKRHATSHTDHAVEEFSAWFRDHHPGDDLDEDIAATLATDWLGTGPAFARFSCSPHRVRATTSVLHDSYENEAAAAIRALLPAWITWCATKTGLPTTLTERSLAEAQHSVPAPRATPDLGRPEAPRIAE